MHPWVGMLLGRYENVSGTGIRTPVKYLQNRYRLADTEDRLTVTQGGRCKWGSGEIGSLGLTHAQHVR